MNVEKQIKEHIASQPEPKRTELQQLHDLILGVSPGCKLWFLDGTNSEGKVVSNPDIGYGSRDHKYADGTIREFYQIGLSANKTGISVYILGIEDKKYLAETYANDLGKATVTGYCIRFKTLKDINIDVLETAIRDRVEAQNDLLFDFVVDKTAKTVVVTKEFAAGLSHVWDAFTKQEILDQWSAPQPLVCKTKYMNFRVGGRRFYAMVSPDGQERWVIREFTSISPKTNFKMSSAFADKDENPELPGSDWDLNFSEQNGMTKVTISIYNESLERLEKMIEGGFKEGFIMMLNNLEDLLTTSSRAKETK